MGDNRNNFPAFFFGFLLGFFLMGVLENDVPHIGFYSARIAKEQCEKSLPRDQYCIPHYVPNKDKQP